ncbi:Ribonuclease H-like superfamily protein [Rhynchospora pubera]|uniref:Ribonuclease H-like superfamily protein n=1 Tax=Rhynchospora pubera TaxID=906938 RepID=A0AAV8C1L5_9POAL|nr:Ribonuclease H-like superfamily protein [Rhynchospora pubera]
MQFIVQNVRIYANEEDRLLWLPHKSGNYNTNLSYKRMVKRLQRNEIQAEDQQDANGSKLWAKIWKIKGVQPRVITFLWRVLHNALFTAKKLNGIFPNVPPVCARCGEQEENIIHLIFTCPSSKAVWFASPLGFRVQDPNVNVNQLIVNVMQNLQHEQLALFLNMMWQVWKARCEFIFRAVPFEVRNVLLKSQASTMVPNGIQGVSRKKRDFITHYELPVGAALAILNGSWDQKNDIGTACVIYKPDGTFHSAKSFSGVAPDAFTAEATTLLNALNHINSLQIICTSIHIFTDSKNLVQSIDIYDMKNIPSWHASTILQGCFTFMQQHRQVTLRYARREHVRQAHSLANQARRERCGVIIDGGENTYLLPVAFKWSRAA